MEVDLRGYVNDGVFHYHNKEEMKRYLSQFNDQEVIAPVSKFKKRRSDKQNRWYWGVCIPHIIAYLKETQGETYTKDDIHDYHLNKVVRPEISHKVVLNETIVTYKIPSTKSMTTVQFMDYKEKIQQFWGERDLIIPDPEQIPWLND